MRQNRHHRLIESAGRREVRQDEGAHLMTQNWDAKYPPETGGTPTPPPSEGNGYPAFAPGYPPAPGYVPPPAYQQGYPGYPPQGPPPTGYGQYPPGYPPGYPLAPGYPLVPVRPGVPGNARAAAVLSFIQAGLVIIAGLGTISGSDNGDIFDLFNGVRLSSTPSSQTFTVMGLLAIVAGGLLIAGGVQLPRKKSVLLVIGSAISLALSAWWLIVFELESDVLVWALLLSAMPIIAICLALGRTTKDWIARP